MQANVNLMSLAAELAIDRPPEHWRRVHIDSVRDLASADGGSLSFLEYPNLRPQLWRRRLQLFQKCTAAAILVPEDKQLDYQGKAILLAVPDVNKALQRGIDLLHPEPVAQAGWHPSAVVAEGAEIGANVELGAHVVIGSGSKIGDNCIIKAGCVIGANCSVGAGSLLHPRVVLYDNCRLGANCILHSGVVIGADGFGFAQHDGKWHKKRHIGRVILGDDVEIGANSSVDRATYGETVVADGCKIDNLVQIGHNVQLGEHSLACAQAGVAGSAQVGDHCIIAGKAAIIDNTTVPAGTTVRAGNIFIKAGARSQLVYNLVQERYRQPNRGSGKKP